jgi:HAE1 family hydrophobic/amphiphilic exporter-1
VNFFIERLIFASAIACGIGSVCYFLAPLAQLPNIAPPQVIVSAPYPGASAQVVADTEKTPVEQQIIGSTKVRTTLDVGYPIDIATVDVQNRVSQATPSLPAIVNRTGVARWKQNPSFALTANLTSSDGSVDPVALSNHASGKCVCRSGISQRRQRPDDFGLDEMLAIIRRRVAIRQALGLFAGEQGGACDILAR